MECVLESRRFLLRILKIRRRPLSRIVLLSKIDVSVVYLNLLYFKWLRVILLPKYVLGLLRGAIRRSFLICIAGSRSR